MTEHQNVDPNEIAKFEEIAERWWDREGEFKPLHDINPLRLDFINDKCEGLFAKTVLDIGCGGGILTESMAKLGANATGIDMGQEPLNVAKLHALEVGVNVDYQKVPAEEFAAMHQSEFDVVTCMEMLEHVPDPESIIRSVAQLVKPGGHVFFSTLNKTTKAYLLAIVAAEKLLKMVPEGTHEHDKFIRPSTLIDWAEKYDLKVRAATGINYNPIGKTFTLTKDVSVNYILHFEKLA
ncbi:MULTISPECIES: bifunctional 2-polyprenyl-6-hydroxyphenol methylase/3-demethylubiquinol 3-O-methyltransferase UbiG [Pseudoalteromonas]|uniref:bifunctional 2-polyprenyl-6-hydroxyphenol methylase/3-demethylubiquinol 3-O-methyltransferase UbiG n=1 Tax=Pseudoalteromonas TaxID=53246 RepID=UPI0005800681|nr:MULTISPECIES: bifunctional 2-polyprenyl-6-hydroxyphenol methylase/3-demethylubiquinol 3-O-methyltransferase UbiG [Pseudoalteromonas]KID34740.1 3-demethylubiquinone-9 3-methyltransferase [Pseudoalteromonas flavipulchra NCIMB 2033 = ATCC BAA-314]MBD0781340.1 bifunctional 2-polyprenyl-6-hydroxyphenol methylase/3-demethylubiquinol 3-O-methyltransferase UbiG [Pseudoalteromonas flavipulchra]MBE0372773.1 2-polyprenyl-6-hydroxyphenyl methylase / 3-demethylubiquinone-9 3-methyltransferase [Pseudoalter